MGKPRRPTVYSKIILGLVGIICITLILYYGQNILIPLLMALLFSILLQPVAIFFKNRLKFPNLLSIGMTVALFVLAGIGVFYFIYLQVTDMVNDIDAIKRNLMVHYSNIQDKLSVYLNISRIRQDEIVAHTATDLAESGKQILGNVLSSFTDSLMNFFLVPVYVFLFLLYRVHLVKFLSKLFRSREQQRLKEILSMIKRSVQGYIWGLLLEMIGVSALSAIGFAIIGLEYALMLGLITGLLNLIPYVGVMIALVISILVALTGNVDLSIIIYVIAINLIVQLIDNNILCPMIVNSKVQINAIVSIVGIIIGGTLAGISGMFLAIPLIAIMKVIFDRIDRLEPWGYLMGDELPENFEWLERMGNQVPSSDTLQPHKDSTSSDDVSSLVKDNSK
ncbi:MULTISPECIES: AI-2E family transporter [Sphingobacterium]|uniref:Putative PurR-regulated permease PerM n=1 Tax=Sphingobacterium siyangense TaxID=459529 RepID=A0A562M9Q3_9SPHI|nr:AI-2E family transporter [Sphingobacterium siyangense]TWI16634.1 putative PurR-regulated permease PerM [Sphingobacterium siyangense]